MDSIKQFFVDNLQVRIYQTRDQMGKACAVEAGRRIRQLLAEKDSANIIFASSPSQIDLLTHLQAEGGIDWHRINAFIMDEYVGLPSGAPQSFGVYLKTHFFSKLPLQQVFYINGSAPDLAAECARYEALLRAHPVDITFAGIGENGHLAFNDPHIADFNDPSLVKVVESLDQTCRQQQVTDGLFESLNEVPHRAITLTIPALMAARHVYINVPGPTKQNIIKVCLEEPVSINCPGSILRNHHSAQLYLDSKSAALLRV
jgi:glucosamine-6-phosphate deaminase